MDTRVASPPESGAKPNADTAALTGIVHLLFFAQTIGIVVAIVLWATRGKENRYIAFQCAQATVLQAGFFVVNMIVMFGFFALWIGGGIAAAGLSDSSDGAAGWAVAGLMLLTLGGIGGFMLLWLAGAAVAIWLAVRCFQGHDPRLPLVGNLATRVTGHVPGGY